MALKYKLQSIDDLDDAVKPLYKESDGGGFELDVEGAVSRDKHNEFVNNNKALFEENRQLQDFKTKAAELEQKLKDAGKQGQEKETTLAARMEAIEKQLETEKQEKTVAQNELRQAKKRTEISKALKAAGVRDEALEDATTLSSQEWDYDDQGGLVRKVGGQPVLSEQNPGQNQGLDEYATGLAKTKPYYFAPSVGDGSKTVPVVGGKKQYDISKLNGAELGRASAEVEAGKAEWIE